MDAVPKVRLSLSLGHLCPSPYWYLSMLGNRAEFALHVFGQVDAEFAFEKIRHAAFAGLAVDADDFVVLAVDVFRVDRQVRHVPPTFGLLFAFGQAFFNRVLVRSAESREDQFAR